MTTPGGARECRDLGELPDLRRLPRVDASSGFTSEVLRRVRAEPARRPAPTLRFAAAGVAVVAVSAAAGAWWVRQSASEPTAVAADSSERRRLEQDSLAQDSLEQLKSEHRELLRELESLRRLAYDAQPFVPVSVDGQTEILFDLRDIEPLPASYATAANRRIR